MRDALPFIVTAAALTAAEWSAYARGRYVAMTVLAIGALVLCAAALYMAWRAP